MKKILWLFFALFLLFPQIIVHANEIGQIVDIKDGGRIITFNKIGTENQ